MKPESIQDVSQVLQFINNGKMNSHKKMMQQKKSKCMKKKTRFLPSPDVLLCLFCQVLKIQPPTLRMLSVASPFSHALWRTIHRTALKEWQKCAHWVILWNGGEWGLHIYSDTQWRGTPLEVISWTIWVSINEDVTIDIYRLVTLHN